MDGSGWRPLAVAAVAATLLAGCSSPAPLANLTFDDQLIGQTPAALAPLAGEWRVTDAPDAPSPPNVLAQTLRSTGYNLAAWTGQAPADVIVEAHVQILSGTTDREAGLALRVQDGLNHYLFNIDANEGGIRFTRVAQGLRDDLAKNLDVPFQLGHWYTLRVEARGAVFRCFVDGQPVASVEDHTFAAGKVGLWTKKDTTARFDDFTVWR